MQVKIINKSESPWKIIEQAAKVSTNKKTEKKSMQFCQNLAKLGHWSPFEHASATILISEISRACSHQLVRHRHLSIVQQSQRYVQLENVCFYTPEKMRDDKTNKFINSIFIYYAELIKKGIPAEDARYILPSAICTELIITANYRAWIEFCKKRMDKSAQEEIRVLAEMIADKLNIGWACIKNT